MQLDPLGSGIAAGAADAEGRRCPALWVRCRPGAEGRFAQELPPPQADPCRIAPTRFLLPLLANPLRHLAGLITCLPARIADPARTGACCRSACTPGPVVTPHYL